MKIGVFDSGVGGLSVANAIKKVLLEHEIILREDREHVPYGIRSPEELLFLVAPIFQEMLDEGCEIIVVACNTVSTNLIDELRKLFKVPMVAIEPMVKPAAEITKSGVIAVCATPTTLASKRYNELKQKYAKDLLVLEPNCADWPAMIEHNDLEDRALTEIIEVILRSKADVIVLGCTHYHWIEDRIIKLSEGMAVVLQPEQAIIRQLERLIARLA